MSENPVVIAVFTSEVEAEMARSQLDAAGIPAAVMSDDAGGMFPSLQQTVGVRLLVAEEHADEALAILEQEFSDDVEAEE